jgi:hypothetical protein
MSASKLLQKQAYLRFAPEINSCPNCKGRLLIRKTHSRKIVLLDIGEIQAEEVHSYCPACPELPDFRSEELHRLVASGAKFGYDVMVHIGYAMFQKYRTVEEIRLELSARQIDISASEVRVQSRRFVLNLAQAHVECQKELKNLLKQQGGYILHLDGTCDGASSHLVSAMDGMSELVLMNVKVNSENAEDIVPMLEKLKTTYGNPLAVVSDMGKAFLAAVKLVFKGLPHYVCHFHFLRDTGKDLLEKDYDCIRKVLRSHGICALLRLRSRELKSIMGNNLNGVDSIIKELAQGVLPAACMNGLPAPLAYALLEWTLAGKQQGDGYGFPFDLPLINFYDRIKTLYQALLLMKEDNRIEVGAKKSLIFKLTKDLQQVVEDKALQTCVAAIHEKKMIFDQLRLALRIDQPGDIQGLNDDGQKVSIPTIEKDVTTFCEKLQQRQDFTLDGPYDRMLAQIKKYWAMLFADSLKIHTPQGDIEIYPNRTNNILERLFRSLNREHRRQTGMNSMRRRLDSMIGDTPLIKNLENKNYLKILLDGCPTLEERFAKIDPQQIKKAMEERKMEVGSTLPGLRKILRSPTWPLELVNFWGQAKVS